MTRSRPFGWGEFTTIRVRLGLALAAALLPVLVLGAVQSVLVFRREAEDRQAALVSAVERSAATAHARIEAAGVLLDTLAPTSAAADCTERLSEVTRRVPGYLNLVRFGPDGAVLCAAAPTPPDAERAARPWFAALRDGRRRVITSAPGAPYAQVPAILVGVPATGRGERGALVAVIALSSLRPGRHDPTLPAVSDVAIVGPDRRVVSATDLAAFPAAAPSHGEAVTLQRGVDQAGQERIFAVAPLTADGVSMVLSAPVQGLLGWAWVSPLSRLALPLLAFVMALAAVLVVAERGVVRWLGYLQRVAAIYARGRFTVRPIQAEHAPPEIRDLGETLDIMARTIVARDASLRESIAQKDLMMREIHHRVKNNLQVIGSLLNLQQRALSDPAARAAISDTRQRINAMALIYRALYEGPDLKQVDLRSFLEDLTGQVLSGDGLTGAAPRTQLHIESQTIDPDKLAPLALFSVEALTHGGATRADGTAAEVLIDFRRVDGQGQLRIVHSGADGVAEGVSRTLMTAFARQLRGTFAHETVEDGVVTQLSFPLG